MLLLFRSSQHLSGLKIRNFQLVYFFHPSPSGCAVLHETTRIMLLVVQRPAVVTPLLNEQAYLLQKKAFGSREFLSSEQQLWQYLLHRLLLEALFLLLEFSEFLPED